MKNRDKAILKDKIIKYCTDGNVNVITNRQLSEYFNVDYSLIYASTQDLIHKGYLKNHADIASSVDYTDFDMILIITPQGRYFLNHEGGATAEYKIKLQKQIWNITRIVAAVANAIVIVIISAWGISVNNKSNKSEIIINQKDSIIYHQTLEIEKLNKFITQLTDSLIIKTGSNKN